MRRKISRRLTYLLVFLAVVGPGIITANVDNDAGGITTYSLAGAHYGYSLLWSLIPVFVFLTVVQEMSSRLGVVTGKGLSDLIRENFGVRVTVYLMIGLVLTNFGNVCAEFAGIAASCELFGVIKYLSVPIGAFLVWWLVVKGTYKSVERIFLVDSLFYVAYLLSGYFAHPDWTLALRRTLVPSFSFKRGYLFMLIGVVGTTIAPWMQFYLQASVVEKGVKVKQYMFTLVDVVVGCVTVNVVAFFIIVTCGATLFANGIQVQTAKDAALSLAPLAGRYSSELFAFGLLNASLFSAAILPISTAYFVCEAMGWESGVNKSFRDAAQFYWLFTGLIVLGAAVILIPGAPLIPIMVTSQVINGVALPFVLIYMLSLINNRELMGGYTNNWPLNAVTWASTVVMILLTAALVIQSILPAFGVRLG
jgi:NRAMP (natural resistance-associated macrophage protein)-like metal ion transporter